MNRCENGCVARKWPAFGKAPNFPKVHKAGEEPPDKADYEWLLAIADRAQPKLRARFLLLIQQLRDEADMKALRDALQAGDVSRAMSALGMGGNLDSRFGEALKPTVEDTLIDAGRKTGEVGVKQLSGGKITFGFDVSNPYAVDFLKNYDMDLIREITDETRQAVKQTVLNAFREGGHPYVQAKQIRQIVGLTRKQAQAVTNFRAARVAENRAADQVDRMTAKYEQKLLRLRATTIARSETMRASNAGQDAAWNSAADKGLINRSTFRRRWLVTPDDRTCFPAQTPIMTIDGWRPISKIKPGELVLTHEDRFRVVEATQVKLHSGMVVDIQFNGRARIKASPTYGHQLLTKRGWIEVEKITMDDEVRILCRPCVECQEMIPMGPGERSSRCPKCVQAQNNVTRWSKAGEREKRSADNYARWSKPGEREKLSARVSGDKNPTKSAATKKKISDNAKRRYDDPVEREKMIARNRRTAKNPNHPFNNITPERRSEILTMAHKARGEKARGMSYLERKMRWFLEQQGIEFEAQWFFTYGEKNRRGFADFYLPGPKIVIECDGPYHLDPAQAERDRAKDAHLLGLGIKVLRFTDTEIRNDFPKVATAITEHCCFMWLKPKRLIHRSAQTRKVYDLQVAEDHSFVAGGIVAHNCIICAAIPALNPDGRKLGEPFVTPIGPVMYPIIHPQDRCVCVAVPF